MEASVHPAADMQAPALRRLPARRPHVSRRVDVEIAGIPEPIPIHLQATYQEMAGTARIVECFARGARKGNGPRDEELSEIAILISLLLRLGMTPQGIRRKLSAADDNGMATSIVSGVVDALVEMQAAMAAEWHAQTKAGGT